MNVFPLILKAQGFSFREAQARLRLLQRMETQQFIEWQRDQAWAIARFHYKNNKVYSAKIGRFFPDRWQDLPVITKKDFQQPLAKLITRGISPGQCYVGSTSGSTGTPFFFAKDKFSHAMTWAIIADRYKLYNLDFSSKQARFYGIPKETWRLRRETVKDIIMNRQRFSVFDLSYTVLQRFLDSFAKEKFVYIYGYTSALVLFSRFLIERNIVLRIICPSLKLCISTSEVCTPEDHVLLEKAFGIQHIREYGVSETCLTAFDIPGKKWCLTEETLLNEVADDYGMPVPGGVEGNILSTSLFNMAFPMIRYQSGDIGSVAERDATGYRSLQSLTGRTNDTVHLPGDKKAAGLTFYYISRSILESTGILSEFIIRQVAIDHFIFDIVSSRDLLPVEIGQMEEKLSLYLMPGLRLDINRVDKIDRPPSGKLKHFYSELV